MEAAFSSCVVLLLAIILFLIQRSRRQRHQNLPPSGPLCLPLIGHLHLMRQPLHHSLARISARHGPLLLLRFGNRHVLVVDAPSLAEECFTANDVAFANRPILLAGKHFGYDNTGLGTAPYGPHWRNLRRIVTVHVFSAGRISTLAVIRAVEVRSLLRQLFHGGFAIKEENSFWKVDMKSKLLELTFNMMMHMITGRRFHRERTMAGAEEDRRFRQVIEEVFHLSVASSLEDFLPLVRWAGVSGMEKQMIRLGREMDEMFQDMIDGRRRRRPEGEDVEEKKSIVDVMLSLQDMDPGYYTDQLIKGIMQDLILGGTETSAGTMEWAMSLLLNHPQVLNKARAEIDTHVGHERFLSDSDLPNLPCLNNIIKETLRLFPAGPLLLPHQSSIECTVGGYNIPRDTMLLINVYSINRSPDMWVYPTEFRPERFEGNEVERLKYIPFGSGRRRCPGEALAMRVIQLALGSLIQCFEWERVGEEEVDLTEGVGLTLPKAVSLEAMCKPRQPMIHLLSQL